MSKYTIGIVDASGKVINEQEYEGEVSLSLGQMTPADDAQETKSTEIPPIVWSSGPLTPQDYRRLLRVFGLDPLWNAWMHLVRRVTGKN